eukprot:6187271-Pleurochrysis_carterae.AAC.2
METPVTRGVQVQHPMKPLVRQSSMAIPPSAQALSASSADKTIQLGKNQARLNVIAHSLQSDSATIFS